MEENQSLDNGKRIVLGISSCLLGNKVRYDGGHKHDRYLTGTLAEFFDFVPVCPEVECGMPIPREALRLVGDPESPRLITNRSGKDFTDQMQNWAARKVVELEDAQLCGFIFKSRSPSSGMERVKVYDEHNMPQPKGVGIFAREFMRHFPLLPVEEEGRLNDMGLRENFIESVFVYRRWRDCRAQGSTGGLVTFHTEHKMLLRAHSEKHYGEMGKLVAQAGALEMTELFDSYQELLMTAMRLKPTVKKHLNVLMHMMGHFKKVLSSDEKQEILEILDRFSRGYVPLIVPITLFNHYVRKYDEAYLAKQHYLNPHPLELKLRNHA